MATKTPQKPVSAVGRTGHAVLGAYRRLAMWGKLGLWLAVFIVLLLAYPRLAELPGLLPGHGHALLAIRASNPDDLVPGEEFTVEVYVSTAGRAINAVGLDLTFDPTLLEMVRMSTATSFCSFYTENSFDTITGEVHLSCGTPSPGFQGESTLAVLTMRSKRRGSGEIRLAPGALVLANDGKGTNILKDPASVHQNITITQTF